MRVIRVVAVGLALLALLLSLHPQPAGASPQSASNPPSPPAGARFPAVPLPPGAISRPMRIVADGSKNPERIPDEAAVLMFLSAIALPADADTRTVAALEAKVARMQLSSADRQRLREELAPLHASLTSQAQAERTALTNASRVRSSAALAQYGAVVEQRTALTQASYRRLLERLSPEGAKKLVAQIAIVKSQMKAIGRPQ